MWIEKKNHYDSRVSLHEAPTKNITMNIRKLTKVIEIDLLNQLICYVEHIVVFYF